MKHLVVIFLTAFCLSASSAEKLPLYKLALEKWEPDPYRAVVIYNKDNPAEGNEGVSFIRNKIEDKLCSLNLVIGMADVTDRKIIDARTSEILKNFKPEKYPFTIIYFPQISDVDLPLWAGYMTPQTGEALCDSPARREIARRMLKGEAAVWLIIKSGIEEKDAHAFHVLTEELKKDPAAADPATLDNEAKDDVIIPGLNPAKMSIIMISRDDRSEMLLLEMLNCMEPEIMSTSNEPAIVPVYGRGRVFDIFSGYEISSENIRRTVRELMTCPPDNVKRPETGTDLLMAVSWDAFLKGEFSVDRILPAPDTADGAEIFESPGVSQILDDNTSVPRAEIEITSDEDVRYITPPMQMRVINIILISVIVLLSALFITVVLKWRK